MLFWKSKKNWILSQFSKYISPADLQKILRSELELQAKECEIHFLVAQVKDEDLGAASINLEKVASGIVERRGDVVSIVSSIVVATFGLPVGESLGLREDCLNTATTLVGILGRDIKLIYGAAHGWYGLFGSAKAMRYGPLIPGFASKLQILFELEYGEVQEVF